MNLPKPISLSLLYLFFCFSPIFSQNTNKNILDAYIKEGLANNASLKTQHFDIDKSVMALEQSKTLFMPQINFQTQYTLAAGGRNIALPIGDLLNPVYSTLNKLTQSSNFPGIENQSITFLPSNFHDTKVHTVYPILNKEIMYNREIKKELITLEQSKLNVYKRELVKNIKLAYVQYLESLKALEIYKNALSLVHENLRVQQKLVKNDIANNATVLKAENEVSKVENSIIEAENNSKNAGAYFNFLLNKPLDAAIEIDEGLSAISHQPSANLTPTSLQREELAQLKVGLYVANIYTQLNASYKTPKIGSFLDFGFQGYGFKIWDKQAYFLLGAQLDIPLYSGNGNKLKVEQAKLDAQKISAQTEEVVQQINLQIQIAKTNLETAQRAIKVYETSLVSAREYYRLTERRYREGQALQIELTDARNQITTAELQKNIAQFNILIKQIELERATGSYQF